MSASPDDALKLLETVWYHNTIVQYASVSVVTFYVYEYGQSRFSSVQQCMPTVAGDVALTFQDEVEYIWKARLTPIKVLFLINRYFAGVFAAVTMAIDVGQRTDFISRFIPDADIGTFWTQFGLWAALFIMGIVENKIVILVVSALFLAELAGMFIIGGLWARYSETTAPQMAIPGTPLCYVNNAAPIPTYLYALQIPYMGFEFILLCLVLFKGFTHFRALRKTSLSPSGIISLVLRDSILFFVCIFVVLLFNTMIWQVGPADLFPLASTWSVIIPTTACSRMLIHMMKAGGTIQDGSNGPLELTTLPTIQSVSVPTR
ncbi:hypothetical protein D9615_002690 [Tricholomella constricta]|uniref:DUF6533 domain-containing protein n=1 Tax=Tricholomella constricta TaxID=117010 RepID=A0A8H5MAA0_9AGAR|nr:hypothetical protein D9615_002690 [Tricholomella constricta]